MDIFAAVRQFFTQTLGILVCIVIPFLWIVVSSVQGGRSRSGSKWWYVLAAASAVVLVYSAASLL